MKLYKYTLAAIIFSLTSIASLAQDANELYEKGEFLKNNNRFQEAIAMFQKASTMEPQNHMIPFEMAACYTGLGDFKKAVVALEKSVKIKPDFNEAYELLGDLYAVQFRNPKKASANYDLAFQYDENIENKVRYKLEIITILYNFNKHNLAFKHIKDAQAILPDNFDLKFYEAQYYVETEQYNKAKLILEKLIVDIPEKSGNEVYFFEMGRTYFYLGEYAKAKDFFTKANNGRFRSLIPIYTPEFFLNVAKVYKEVFEYEKSEEVLKIVFAMDEPTTEAYDLQKELASVKTKKAKLIQAEKSAIEQEKDQDKLAERYSELALYAFQEGDHIQAATACEEYLNLKPLNYDIMFLHAMSLSKMSRPDEATNLLRRMLKNPKVPRAYKYKLYFGLGLAYKDAKRLDEAEDAFKDAYGGPTKEASRYELMEIFKIRQRQDQADTQE